MSQFIKHFKTLGAATFTINLIVMLRIISIIIVCVATGFTPAGLRPASHTMDSSSTIKVHGTSTLHDWTMVMEKVSGEATVEVTDAGLNISRVYVRLRAEDLKSEYDLMDKNTYEALKTDRYPYLTYDMSTVHSVTQSGNSYNVDASGVMSIAGSMKTVRMTVKVTVDANGNLTISGKKAMKMTDFGVEPPEVMFGTISTGDDIEIEFNTKFNASGNS